MPWTWVQPVVGGPIGVGMLVRTTTDFVGPIQQGSTFRATLYDSDAVAIATEAFELTTQHELLMTMGFDYKDGVTISNPASATTKQGAPGLLKVLLADPLGNILSTDERTVTIDNVSGLYYWQQLVAQTTAGSSSGLTTEQAQQLQETHDQVVVTKLLDAFTLSEITSGPQGGTVSANLVAWIWGVIVRIADVPSDLTPNTPDSDYWTPSLAVVRLYRGADLFLRIPVHTSSKLINFSREGFEAGVSQLLPTQWLVNLSVQVSFRNGVTGQVFLMRLP